MGRCDFGCLLFGCMWGGLLLFEGSLAILFCSPSAIGVGPWPIVISDSSQLWRQCCTMMFLCDSWVAFSEAFSLLASIGSCTAVWTNVGRLVSC